jgi:A/G-specific adenine glycosylase
MISEDTKQLFQETVWDFYRSSGRHDLPWRLPLADGSFDGYKIFVSEVMLQQTQVSRVIPKFLEFISSFPTVSSLAAAEQGEVLRTWSGLGYNRRARYLHQAAQAVVAQYGGIFPADQEQLVGLPGIGVNTAGAILAYTYNLPASFIETNIRTVYIHSFFAERMDVSDAEISALVAETLDHENPREWYWALMDYGSYLKQEIGNLNKLSKSYAKQSAFHGSKRQIRGQVLKLLAAGPLVYAGLEAEITDERLPLVIQDLLSEGLINEAANGFQL